MGILYSRDSAGLHKYETRPGKKFIEGVGGLSNSMIALLILSNNMVRDRLTLSHAKLGSKKSSPKK